MNEFLRSFTALFLITDILGNLPFFISLTEGMSVKERRNVFNTALITGFALLLVFVFAGALILDLFKLTMNDLRIAGGILLLLISIEVMIRGKIIVEHKEDIGVVPLGSPLLVGPGAITTAMVLLSVYGYLVVISSIVACFIVIWLVLFFADQVHNFLGKNGSLIITKIMAILIAAIAVQFVREGIMALIK